MLNTQVVLPLKSSYQAIFSSVPKKVAIKLFVLNVFDCKDDEKYETSCMQHSDLYHHMQVFHQHKLLIHTFFK